MRRQPAVAGRFYPGTAEGLGRQVMNFLVPVPEKVSALGIVSPHAGLIYSGAVAGAVYSRLDLPGRFVLIGPNHTGLGAPLSLMAEGSWETPLGSVPIDTPLARSILSRSPRIREDSLAHLHEHSLEVQLPFLQYLKKEFTFVPIQMLDTRLETCLDLGKSLAAAITETTQKVLIVASSDMSHYEQASVARKKDFLAIKHILDRDPEGLYRTVKEEGITMCGFGPAVAMLAACNTLGASRSDLVQYANSGDVSGDFDQVVGYAGLIIR
jgi:AmmeMemoRadiSam system protein B